MVQREIKLSYAPRESFKPFHNRKQRWACLVAHRRAGKTVSAVNDIIRAAVTCRSPNPLFGYIAPFRSQAKSVAWDYFKRFCAPIMKSANEAELTIELINGAKIRLFGADNADAMRGLGFDGIYMDEYGDFRPSVWGSVIRPTLSDKQGWAVFGGTPKGKNQFWDIFQTARMNPDEWFCLRLTATQSGILPMSEINAVKAQISEDQYMQEYECSFEAAILGAFYGIEMRIATEEKRVTDVAYDPSLPTHTAWDLGYRDDTAIWWYQVISGEIHIIDYHAVSGASIQELAKVITQKPYHYGTHYLPHDARAKTLAAQGKSIIEQLGEYLGVQNLRIVPDLSVQDGIQAVRQMLSRCWFDERKCMEGIEALRQYEREFDEDKKAFRATPKHNWCFTGNTKVLTRYGMCQISNLPQQGKVLTSCGWKTYRNPRITRKNAPLVMVTFKDGLTVKCTPDHLFKTENGWKSAESLTKGMLIQSSLTPLRNISMAVFSVFFRLTNILNEAVNIFIGKLGESRLAQFLMTVISTTKTATEKTILWKILNAFLQKFICKKPLKIIQNDHLMPKLEKKHLIGINRKRVDFGIEDMHKGRSLGQNGSESLKIVRNAMSSLIVWLENQEILKFIVRQLAKLKRIVNVGTAQKHLLVIEKVQVLNEMQDVWCMDVPSVEEFSLCNGALVHNCSHPADAFRMLAIAWRDEPVVRSLPSEKPLIVGPGNTATLNDMWASHKRIRRSRI